jgi:peptidoglycan-associated lipoprotein
MRKIMAQVSVVLFCGAMMLSGCAKEQVVKKDEPVAPPSAEKSAAKPADPAKLPVTEEKIASPAIKESPVAREEAVTASSAANEQAERLLNAIFFDFDSATLSPAARDTLSGNAALLLKKHTGVNIQVEGHCDERGSAEYNLALGERRAQSAMNYLVTLGVPASRLSTISYGKEKPADQGHDDAAWAKNRRAEFMVAK